MAKPTPPVLMPCGHFSQGTNPDGTPHCTICGERAAIEQMKAQTAAASRPGFTSPAGAEPDAAVAALGTDRPQPGVYQIPDSVYFRDPLKAYGTESLSGSSMRLLVQPSTPAHFRWRIDHPADTRTAAMILGNAVHALTLGTAELAVFEDGRTWESKAAQQFLAEHDPDGDDAPILARDVPAAKAMARALLDHRIVKMGLRNGEPEQAMFARHPETGTWLRGKVDYLARAAGDHLIITDIKTAECAHESEFTKSAGKYGYDTQAAAYERILQLLKLAKTVTMIFAVVEKTPPYLVAVHEIDSRDLRMAAEVNEAAIRTFARCLETGTWDGYPVRINRISLPPWVVQTREAALLDADDDERETA